MNKPIGSDELKEIYKLVQCIEHKTNMRFHDYSPKLFETYKRVIKNQVPAEFFINTLEAIMREGG